MAGAAFGKYLIKRELGRGAMGVVYEADDRDLGQEVALKVLSLAPGAGPESRRRQVERFSREARALAGLRHPNVVRMFEQGEVSGRHYFTMEVVRGTTLRDRIQLQGPLALPDLVRLASELCEALDHIHSRWVVHRDIKPENVMLLPDNSAKLMDFGIALLLTNDDLTTPPAFEGSPSYMSPEQVKGLPVDGRADIYSLAVTLYEAATARRAVEGETVPTILHKVANEYPPPPVGLPVPFQAALLKGLAKDPAQRYLRAGQMAEDIRAGRVPAGVIMPAVPTGPAAAPAVQHPLGYRVFPSESPYEKLQENGLTKRLVQPGRNPGAPPCSEHPSADSIAFCSQCGRAVCHACLVDIPGRGVRCRGCAFARRV